MQGNENWKNENWNENWNEYDAERKDGQEGTPARSGASPVKDTDTRTAGEPYDNRTVDAIVSRIREMGKDSVANIIAAEFLHDASLQSVDDYVSGIKLTRIMEEYAKPYTPAFSRLYSELFKSPSVRKTKTGKGHATRWWYSESDVRAFCKNWTAS